MWFNIKLKCYQLTILVSLYPELVLLLHSDPIRLLVTNHEECKLAHSPTQVLSVHFNLTRVHLEKLPLGLIS